MTGCRRCVSMFKFLVQLWDLGVAQKNLQFAKSMLCVQLALKDVIDC